MNTSTVKQSVKDDGKKHPVKNDKYTVKDLQINYYVPRKRKEFAYIFTKKN